MMATMLVGGAVVPIDCQFPSDRVAYIMHDSGCQVLLTTFTAAAQVPTEFQGAVVDVDSYCSVNGALTASLAPVALAPHDLAYIIYTSGTTGRPKGVMVEYGCLESVVLRSALAKCFQPGQVCLQFFSVAFDPHLFVLFSALTHGCTLRIMQDEDALGDVQRVDVAAVTPSFLARIDPTSCPSVQTVIVTGEACPQALVDKWAKQCIMVNGYGPSETFFTHAQWLSAGRPVDIGKPLVNVSSYVVDQNLHLVPLGVVGELLIGGIAPGRGYCSLPELTAERFLPNPFGPGRVYRTGDLVRWLPDGHLEYLGRRDNQVKLNGFRIELDEIESVVGQCSQVQQAAAIVHRNRLLCFVTPELSDFAPLVDHLRQKLPHYMVPHTLVALAQFPTTVNGKVDRRALADLELTSTSHCSLVAEATALDLDTDATLDTASDHAYIEQETVLRQAWAELLDVPLDRIARQAHFFQLGGDSIVAILLVSKCRQQGYQLTVPTIYAHPVLASLARQLGPLHSTTVNTALCAQTPVTGPVPLTPIQQWFFGLPLRNPHHFNQSFLLKLAQPVDATIIQGALVTLLTHHDMLRCRYTQHDNQWQQTIPTAEATHDDYCWAECHTTEAELSQHLAHLHTQLNLTQGPLFGALLLHLDTLPHQPRLYLVSHHVVIDLVSWRILIDDLNTLLSHQPLPPKTLSFAQWATSLDAHAATLSADCWPEQVSPADAAEPSPVDQVGTRHAIFHTLDADLTDRLVTHVCPALRVTPRDAILSAYALAYCQTLAVSQVNLCMEGHGREPWSADLDISRTVGWFTLFYPLVLHTQHNATLAAILHQAKERLQQIPNKGFPYFVLKYVANASADERIKLLAKTPAHLDVLFNYFGRFTQSTSTRHSLVSIDWSDQYGEHDYPTEDWVPFHQYVMAMISGNTLRLGIDYNTRRCTDTAMTTLLTTWASHLRDLVQAFAADPLAVSPAVTRFDFDLLPLTVSDFDQLSAQLTQRHLPWYQVEDLYPCTPLQSGLLLSTLRNSHAYLVQYHVTLTGDLDVHRLEASWQQVAQRHSILRTVFLDAPSQVTTGFVQAVLKQSIVRCDVDLTQSADELSTQAYQRLSTDFALDSPLFQVSVGALPNTTNAHQMTVTFHHAMLDGWSFPLLVAEVLKCYQDHPMLESTASAFKDVTQHILGDRLTDSPAQFWQAYLANAPSTSAPLIHPQLTPTAGYKGYRAPLAISKPLLLSFARSHGITLSSLLRGAYALALSRYLHTREVVFGVVVSGRNVPVDGIEAVIGPCLNTLPFRVNTRDQSIVAYLQQIHHDYVQMIPYEQSSNVDIARWCHQPSDARLFHAAMGYENQPPLAMPADSPLAVSGVTVEEYTEYPFSVAFEDQSEAVLCKVLWAQSMYSPEVGAEVVKHLSHILDQIVCSSATTQLQSIRLHASEAHCHPAALLSSPSSPLDATLGDLRHAIRAHCSAFANDPALVHAQQTYTWSTLVATAITLSRSMLSTLAGSNRVVVVVADSHLALVVSLLACIQCEATLVPISTKVPIGSIRQLLSHLSPALVLIPVALDHYLNLGDAVAQVILDDCYDVPFDGAALQWPTDQNHTRHSSAPAVRFIQGWGDTGVQLLEVSTAALLQTWTDQPYLASKGTRVAHSFALDSDAALWTTIGALSQGCLLVDTATASADDASTTMYVTDANTTAISLPCQPVHLVRLVPLSMIGIGSVSHATEPIVTIQLYGASVFAGCASLTLDRYEQCVATNTLPSSLPFAVVDSDGYACPVGVAGVVCPTAPGVARASVSHGSYIANPWWSNDSRPFQLPIVHGFRLSDGSTTLAGTGQSQGTLDGVQVYPELIAPFLRQVGLCPLFTTLTPTSQLVTLVDSAEFDLSSYEHALAQVLPQPLQSLTILSTTVFPHLLSIKDELHCLDAFATAYRQVLQHQNAFRTDLEQWLAVHWIAQGHAKCDPATALTSSFWVLGGSLAELVALRHRICAKFSITLPIPDMHSHSHFAAMCTLIDTYRTASDTKALSTLPAVPIADHWPVLYEQLATAPQLKVWCQTHDNHSTGEWYYQQAYHTGIAINVAMLRHALTWLINAYDPLRTFFTEVGGQVRQRVLATPMPLAECPLIALDQVDPIDTNTAEGILDQHHATLRADTWPLVSLVVLNTNTSVHSAHVSMRLHPLIGNCTAAEALGHSLWQCYDHMANGLPLASLCLPSPRALLSHHSSDEPTLMGESMCSDALAYWQQLTANVPTAVNLPTDLYIREDSTHQVQSVAHVLLPSTHTQLHTAAAQSSTEPFVLWLALLSVYLARITRQDELLIGVKLPTAWAKHSLPSHQASLLVHSHSESHNTLPRSLAVTQQQLDASLPHAAGSLEHLVQAMGLGCDSLVAPVPNVVVEFTGSSTKGKPTLNQPASPSAVTGVAHGPALHLAIDLAEQSTNITAYYSRDQFSPELARNLLANLDYFVSNALACPDQLTTVPLTRPDEVATLLRDYAPGELGNDGTSTLGDDAADNVVRLVQATADAHPALLALEYNDHIITYHDLIDQASAVAASLQAHGVVVQSRVAVLVENHPPTVVTMLALWALGAIYVPIDAKLPVARQTYTIETAECTIVIDATTTSMNWPNALPYSHLLASPPNASTTHPIPCHRYTATELAYIIFTSGTTGQPKGVPIYHHGLMRLVQQDQLHLCPSKGTRLLHTMGVSFDGYVFTVALCLGRQGTLVFNTGDLISAAQQAQTALLTPSMLSVLDPHTHANLESIATCGEALSFYLAQTWVKCCPVHNGYGPSEATVMSHSARVHLGQVVTIGRPIPHSPCYILDAHRNVVPIGIAGEIYIGGPAISPGYLQRPGLNATKFIINPFGKGTLYATGDLGRWLSNGEVECLGRIDDQIKVRGYRIEQAEVMGALLAQPAVTAGAVQVCDQQLVAFATPPDIDITAVLNALATQLPHYMVPSHIVPVASIPQTANGKVDARALEACFAEYQKQLQANALASTRTQSRQLDALQQAVGQVLGMDSATVNPGLSFIQLGGDSISAIQLSSQLKQLHYNVPIPAILTRMPLRDLADTIDECHVRAVSKSLLEPARDAPIPLTPIQATFFGWSLHNPHHFNQSFVMELTQPIAHGQLNDALQQLVGHHAILRSQFTQTADGDWVQHLASPTDPLAESLVDVITCDRASLHTHLVQVQRKLDLAKGPLMRGALIELQIDYQTPPTALLFLTVHHLVVDLVSWCILLEDLHCLLQKKRLAPVPVSFGAWACALQDWGKQWTSDDTACEWTLSLPSIDLSSLDLNAEGNCVTASFTLPAPLMALFTQLESYAKCFSVTPTELLLAALAQALHRVSTDHTVTIWHENHGRYPWSSDVDLSRTVGWFTALYPVTVTVDSAWSHACFVQRVKHALRTLPHHGLVHGIQRLKQVNCSDTSTYQPLGVVFNYQGQTTDQSTLTLHGQAPWTMRPDLAHGLPVCDGHERRPQLLEVLAYQQDDAVQFDLLYCPQAISSATIAALTNELQQALHEMLTGYAHTNEALYWAPCDFPLLGLTWDDLDAIGHELVRQNINPATVEDLYPMLPTQQGLLTATAKDPSQYTVQTAFTVQGVGDPSQLHKAFQRVVAQHAILRTRFLLHWARPGVTGLQVVLCSSDIEWQVIDSWATLNAQDEDEYMRQNYARGFTIGGPMLRCMVVPMADNQLRLVLTMHHAITDGWSMGLLKRALLQELRHSSALPATASPSAKFRDYAEHMLRLESTASAQFWQAHLQAVGEATILTLPKAPNPTTTMQSQVIPLLDDLAEFQRLTQQAGFTINAVLKATWALLLHRYTGQSSIVFGHTVSGRNLNVSRIDQLVGCLINTVPFCVQVARSMPLLDLLHQVSQASTATIPHEHCHLSAIQQWTRPDLNVLSLFNTLLVYENVPATQHATDGGTIAFTDPHELEFTEYDLAAAIEPVHNQLVLHLSWNAHRLDQAYAIRLSQYLSHLLLDVGKALAHSSTVTSVDQLLALPELEQRMLNTFTTNPLAWDESKTVVDLFTACAQRHPHVAAVEQGPAVWDYHTLYSKVHQLAHWLLCYGMAAQEPVGIVVARTPAVIAMLLGVSMAGGAFVLIDPEHPLNRISFIASDCGIKHLCCTALHAELAQRVLMTMAVAVHEIDAMLATAPETTPSNVGHALPSNLAYILYTSGSTGQPKGAMIEHRGLSNLVQQTPSVLPHMRSHFRHMQALAMTFDACIWDVFTTLCHGGTLVLRDDIARTLHHVDSALLTPSLMAALDPAQYPNLKTIMAVGERLPSDVALKWTQQCLVVNGYGPTETTIITTTCRYQPNALVTIGRPIHNTEVYILDPHLRPAPIGAVGELHIGGPGVMRGYVNRPDLDAKALVTHPSTPNKHLFKTGDLGRWLANGEIECLGRQDDQVKIRGMRLELQEVEAVLQQCPTVTMAAVLVFENALYAVVCPAQIDEAMAKTHLSSQLPAYMVPARIVALDAIPLTVNGKADKRALLENISQLKQQSAPRSISPPQTSTQAIIREAMAVALAIGAETIDIDDSFFTLGGDSLSAIRLTGLCREKGLSITVDQVFDKATVAALAQVCQDKTTMNTQPVPSLSTTQPPAPFALLNFTQDALERVRKDVAQQLGVIPTAIVDIVPMSSLQTGFIVNTLKDPSAYMVQQSHRITGALDVDRYRQCWQQVGQRHSILRTKFVITDLVSGHTALQAVLATMDMAWSYDDNHDPSDADYERSYFAADRQHGFAFDGSPLIRMALFKITDTDHWLFLTFHHALLDAWSTNIVLDEVLVLYHEQPLYPALQYHTYLAHLMCKPTQTTQAFWQTTLNKVKPTPDLQLPSRFPPSPLPSPPSCECHKRSLSCPLADIHAFSQRLGITTNNLLRGLWALLLSRYLNEQDEVTFGVLVSGRNEPLPGIDDIVGLSINTVPFRAALDHQQPLHDWLQDIHRLSGAIMAHEHASLVDVQKWAGVPADTPLFQSLLVYDKYRESALALDDQRIQCTAHDAMNFTEYPLTVSFTNVGNELHMILMYNASKYDAAYITLISAYLDACLSWIVESTPNTLVESVWQLPPDEHSAITIWSQGQEKTLDPSCQLLPDLFLHSVSRTPDAIALECGNEQWTYAQVHQQALVIVQWLIVHQVQPGDRVALVFTRSPHFVFAVLAVLLVGGVYVPIDATVTAERIDGILADLFNPIVLLERHDPALVERLSPMASEIGICSAMAWSSDFYPIDTVMTHRYPPDLAYIIFTSGTTGKPKGVQVRHESAVNILIHLAQTMELQSGCRFLQLLNIAFDGCLIELFSTFYAGGTVVLSTSDISTDLHHANACFLTPSLLSVLNPADYPNVRKIIGGGEALPWEVANKWYHHCTLYHAYGPTEITVISNIEPFDPALSVCFSQPIPNALCHVLDRQRRPVPVGVPGEICIAGVGVSNGYLNQPDLTGKVFVSNPFGAGQMYLTGDMGCWLPNGKIKYLGRKDFQVKLRGFRIELDSITNYLARYEGVQQACVVVQDNQLIGYVSPQDIDAQAITAFAKSRLPHYMVPAAIVALPALPLTPVGKIDRKALPKYTFTSQFTDASTIPRTTMEDQLIRMVAQVLSIPQETISPQDTFFQLGGDSLSAIRLSAHCRNRGLKLMIPRLFERPALSDVAEYALEAVDMVQEVAEKVPPFALLNQSADGLGHTLDTIAHQLNLSRTAIEDVLPTSSLQEGFVVNTLKDPSAYMVQQAFEITGDLDVKRYQNAWHAVCQHYAILRTKFAVTDYVMPYSSLQVVAAHADIAWHYDECPTIDCSDIAAFKQAWLAKDRAQGFHLDGSPLVRLTLVAVESNFHVLLWSFHHALLDAWSVTLVLDQVLAVYYDQSLPPTLPYSAFIHHTATQDPKACQAFWQTALESVKPMLAIQLPSTTPVCDSMKTHATHSHTISTPSATILQFCHQHSITLNTLIRAVWAMVLGRYLDERDEVTFGTLVSGRNVPLAGIDQMVGLTINTVPFRAKLDLDAPIHAWLSNIHTQSTAIMAYEHASLVDIMHWAHATPEQPLFATLLVHTPTHESTQPQYKQTIRQMAIDGYNATEYPLVASFGQDGEQVVVSLQYACAKYDSAYIGYLASYIDHCVASMISATDTTPLASLFSLPSTESQQIEQWAHGEDRVLDPTVQYLDELFTRNLDQRPDAVALESGDQQWTYAEVYQHAVAIANHLQTLGVTHQTKVALVFTRSPHFVFSLLAVLMLGAVYIPIDATNGTERVCGILNDLGQPVVVTSSSHVGVIDGWESKGEIMCVDPLLLEPSSKIQLSTFNYCRSPKDLAYIIFTSGTTGKPKGVQIRHESAVNILIFLAQTMELDSNCRFLQLLNIAFDGCLIEMFTTFYAGGTLVLAQADISADLHKVNSCLATPSLLAALDPQDYPNLQTIGSCGEALPWATTAQWQPNRKMINIYGPTEITISSHAEPVDLIQCITLGGPVPNTQCYVLDTQQRPVPIGVPGEICIAGVGVSNGYLNHPDLTVKAFVPNLFGAGQMYLTGDMGCWLPNGKLKYLGRKDFQVKLRGFRIELSEVEQAIMKHPLVTAACAIVQDGILVAFVTPSACDLQSITQLISQSLPPYMVPAANVLA
ncbi:hypothetical protein H4R35_001466 [Dimargaris xerosporica]|nr:hypothetical protein H4R35_001466 [Dimargaris xerosporica]